MAITLRSSKELQVRKEAKKRRIDSEAESENHNQSCNEKRQDRTELTAKVSSLKGKLKRQKRKRKSEFIILQYPFLILKKTKLDEQFAKFLNMFRKLEINIPFTEALAKMPHMLNS